MPTHGASGNISAAGHTACFLSIWTAANVMAATMATFGLAAADAAADVAAAAGSSAISEANESSKANGGNAEANDTNAACRSTPEFRPGARGSLGRQGKAEGLYCRGGHGW